ncbi:MAG: type II toxin-antitoxin system prevent-host-death family antitoxin [Betaproteobacteria bacterium]|nr:type II toxin-antitoxin system prevent-host-death family antitoxin [Betaproteobacteria bacterium]
MRPSTRQPAGPASSPQWQLQTAKAQLSEVVEAALRGEPQRITRRGKDAVMVVSEASFLALKNNAKRDAGDFVAHLLAMPREISRERAGSKPVSKSSGKLSVKSKAKAKTGTLHLRDIEL